MAGDQLLIGVGERLSECLRQVDTVARLGGDEFVILLEDINGVEDATRAARRIQEAVSLPFDLGENELFTTASIGIAVSSSGYDQAQDILRDADIAMYRAKALGKARYELFDKSMHGRAVELLQLETDLRRAVERHEFRLFYQPIVLLGSGQIIGFEGLIRWMHPQRGLTQPAAFLPLAEETGLSVPMGQWVLRQACRQLRLWKDRLPAGQPLAVSINLSSKQLLQPGLTKIVQGVLEEFDISPSDLHLEITEGVIMAEPEAVVSKLAGLRSLGVKLPIDDFGTGYSSLAYLHRFPISGLKIDRSFVTRVAENEVIVRTIVSLAHNLGMEVIAEGVETQGQADRLLELGCEYAQGFLFSRPVEAEAATALLLAPISVPA
jgi:predicted signal transduction protein with EAL and GGDEF domain